MNASTSNAGFDVSVLWEKVVVVTELLACCWVMYDGTSKPGTWSATLSEGGGGAREGTAVTFGKLSACLDDVCSDRTLVPKWVCFVPDFRLPVCRLVVSQFGELFSFSLP